MKRILPEFTLTDEQLNIVRALARECGLCEETVKILFGRGLRDKESITRFMNPSKSHFVSPFKMSGMTEAVKLITRARDEGWAVLVYGDYDADGICASTIMSGALRDFGIEPFVTVPERKNGYGLSQGLIDEIFDEYFPQLVITVDCGISGAAEVEYIKELGAEVIVTDHHELPDIIPDCICINPKFEDGYEYDNLCGAGVAFKVACALNGEDSYKYLDYAAIATVADSVPLTGENRDIVYEGLKLINSSPKKNYSYFLGKQDVVTSQTVAFSIAPKINAAGRMGDAKAALSLFDEQDETKIFELASKLSAYNIERQQCCDELYNSAKQMIKEKGDYGKIIMLCNENWNTGFVGIVAAKIVEEFSRPAILFVKNGDMLKGSARSIENVNVFEALKACSQYIAEFGGHSQAAGVNVTADNFEKLEAALNEYMGAHYTEDDFAHAVYVNGSADSFSLKFVKELERLEPFGMGNRRPLFEAKERSVPVRTLKGVHLSVKSEKLEFMYFGGAKYKKLIESSAAKKFIFEFNVSEFRGKETVKGFIRDVVYGKDACYSAEEDIALCALETLSAPKTGKIHSIKRDEVVNLMLGSGAGTVFLTWDAKTVERFPECAGINCDLFTPSLRNFSTSVLYAPDACADLSGYRRVILLDTPAAGGRLALGDGKEAEICDGAGYAGYLRGISCEREILLDIFSKLSANAGNLEGASAYEVVKCGKFADKLQYMFAIKVFEQLGLLTFGNGRMEVIRGVKSRLENSELFNIVREVCRR